MLKQTVLLTLAAVLGGLLASAIMTALFDHYAEVQTVKHARSITVSCRDGADPTVVWPPAVDGQLEVSCGK